MIRPRITKNDLETPVIDMNINAPIRSLKASDAVQAVALSPDGLKVAIASKDGSLKLVTPMGRL